MTEEVNQDEQEMVTQPTPTTVSVSEPVPPTLSQLQVEEVGKEKSEKSESEKPRSPLETVDLIYRVIYTIFFVVVWVVMIGVWLYFAYSTTTQLITALNSPGTTVSYIDGTWTPFPMVTICNYFYDSGITFDSCYNMTDDADCDDKVRDKPIDVGDGSVQHCLQFNFDPDEAISTNRSGRRGGVVIGFTLEADAVDSTLEWAQVTFTLPGKDPTAEMLDDELRYVQGGQAVTYGAQMIKRVNISNAERVDFETSSSVFVMTPFPPPHNLQYAEVAIAYRTLAVQQITEVRTYQFQNWLGDNSGVIGTLTGISVIKFMGIIARIYPGLRARSFGAIGDLLTS